MAFPDLKHLFDAAAREFPDLMEPYVNRLGDADPTEHEHIMRVAMSETIRRRYPLAREGEAA